MDGESDENLFGDDSDQESIHNQVSTDNGPQAPDLDEELFGDFDDDEQVTQNEPATYADEVDENHQDLFEEQRDDHEYTYDRAELPNILGPKDNSNLFLLKIPKFLNIESKPFDPETFIPQDEEERVIKTTVRWRHGLNENESNARVVRWSDGSFSLLVGDESFDVTTTDIKDRNQFLTFQHPDEGFLQTQARLSQFMSFTPSSTSAVSHKLMMTQVSKLNRKGKRTKQYIINEDPEEIARKAEKLESEKLKARRKLENKRRSMLEQEIEYPRESRYNRNSRYSDQPGDRYQDDGFIVEEDDDYEDDRNDRLMQAKRGYEEDYSEEEEPDYTDDEHEDRRRDTERERKHNRESEREKEPAKPAKRLRVIEDSDDDE